MIKRARQSALAALSTDTATASGMADGFVTAGAVIAALGFAASSELRRRCETSSSIILSNHQINHRSFL
jgi:hypothetical protein